MERLVVGCDRPIEAAEGADGRSVMSRRWPATVHAVRPWGGPVETLCGSVVLFRFGAVAWPPGPDEDWCPECFRATSRLRVPDRGA